MRYSLANILQKLWKITYYWHNNYDHIKYCRITNVDTANDIKLVIEYSDSTPYRLRPGESLILHDFEKYSAVTSADADPPPLTDNIEDIGYTNTGDDCWVEIFMASTGGDL